jgi:hypothetical protein
MLPYRGLAASNAACRLGESHTVAAICVGRSQSPRARAAWLASGASGA